CRLSPCRRGKRKRFAGLTRGTASRHPRGIIRKPTGALFAAAADSNDPATPGATPKPVRNPDRPLRKSAGSCEHNVRKPRQIGDVRIDSGMGVLVLEKKEDRAGRVSVIRLVRVRFWAGPAQLHHRVSGGWTEWRRGLLFERGRTEK